MSASNSRTLGLETSGQGNDIGLGTVRRSNSQCGKTPLRSGTPVHRDVAGIPYSGPSIDGPVNLHIGVAMHDCRKEDEARSRLPSRRAAFCIVLAVGALSAAPPLDASEQCRLCHPDEVTACRLRSSIQWMVSGRRMVQIQECRPGNMETGEGLVDTPGRSSTVSLYNRFDEGRAVVYGFKLGLLSAQLVDRAGFEGHVAQLVRAPASHAGGPQFESGRAHQVTSRIRILSVCPTAQPGSPARLLDTATITVAIAPGT